MGALTPEESPNDDLVRDRLGIECEAELAVEGTFTPSAAQPTDVFGCWPVGTWRFDATVVSNGCATAPTLDDEYVVEVTRDAEEIMHYSFASHASADVGMKVTSGGGGICEGGFEIFGADGKTLINFKPALLGGEITGQGDYVVYKQVRW